VHGIDGSVISRLKRTQQIVIGKTATKEIKMECLRLHNCDIPMLCVHFM
jgi:hypothetical protein